MIFTSPYYLIISMIFTSPYYLSTVKGYSKLLLCEAFNCLNCSWKKFYKWPNLDAKMSLQSGRVSTQRQSLFLVADMQLTIRGFIRLLSSVMIESKSGKTRISAHAHPSATGGRVSGLVNRPLVCSLHSFTHALFICTACSLCQTLDFIHCLVEGWKDKYIQLSFTRAHSKGLSKIMPYNKAVLLPIQKQLQNVSWDYRFHALQAGMPYQQVRSSL